MTFWVGVAFPLKKGWESLGAGVQYDDDQIHGWGSGGTPVGGWGLHRWRSGATQVEEWGYNTGREVGLHGWGVGATQVEEWGYNMGREVGQHGWGVGLHGWGVGAAQVGLRGGAVWLLITDVLWHRVEFQFLGRHPTRLISHDITCLSLCFSPMAWVPAHRPANWADL